VQFRLAHENNSVNRLTIYGVYSCFVIYVSAY